MNNQPQFKMNSEYRAKKTAKPFLLTLLALVLIAAAAFGGWWYGNSRATKDGDAKVANLEKQIAVLNEKMKNNSKDTKQDDTTKYLNISQWGVRVSTLNLPTNTNYNIEKISNDEVPLYGSGSQMLKWTTATKYPNNKTIVSIVRSNKPSYVQPLDGAVVKPIANINNNYYYLNAPYANSDMQCKVDNYDQQTNSKSKDEISEFETVCKKIVNSSKTIEAIPPNDN